jgi:predicted MFS family arabinose efflux permease
MLIARGIAGFFGGPATALAMSLIIDVVPDERRGRAMGIAMGAFSAASVLGVPLGLELAHIGDWHWPFMFVAGLGAIMLLLLFRLLPPMRFHMKQASKRTSAVTSFWTLFYHKAPLAAYVMTSFSMIAAFLVIPHISAFVQFNLDYPREKIGLLYFVGGIVSFFAMRVAGRLSDHWGRVRTGILSTLILLTITYFGFVHYIHMPVILIFVFFMMAMSMRNVVTTTVTSSVPLAHERAAFMSLNAAVQHSSAAAGAIVSSMLLSTQVDGSITGMPETAAISMGLAALLPPMMLVVQRLSQTRRALNAL